MGPDTNTGLDRKPVGKHTYPEYLAEKYGTLNKSNKTEGSKKIYCSKRPKILKMYLVLDTIPSPLCAISCVNVLHK
jgi:hypothetical protein